MADKAWKQFKENIKQKRVAKRKATEKAGVSAAGEIIVQRLSATVSGKAQKYSRVGAREFVPFDQFEELTVDNIKEACEQHFTENKIKYYFPKRKVKFHVQDKPFITGTRRLLRRSLRLPRRKRGTR